MAGGPQSAEQALSGFLGSGAAEDTPVEGLTLDDLTSIETGDGYVVFQKGHDEDEVIVVVTKQREGLDGQRGQPILLTGPSRA